MIRMTIDGVTATATEKEVLTAGRVGLRCAFEFVGGEWGDLFKTAVFQGIETIDVALPTNECVVPWEAMAVEGVQLKVGVYGANGNGDIVIPTVWANFGKIQPSAVPSGVDPATPSQNANAYAVETAEQALAIAQSVRTDADNGVFDGEDGADGFSPTATVSKAGDTATITITDENGTTTANISDGTDGADGSTFWLASAAPTHETPGGGKPEFDYYLDSSLSGPSGGTPAVGDVVFYSSLYYPIVDHADAAGIGVISIVDDPIDLSTKFWTNTQVGLLQQVFQHLKYDSASAGEIAAELITSLQGNAVWDQDQITLLDALLSHVKYTDGEGDTYADTLIDALCGNAISPISIPEAYTSSPIMDGTAAAGSSGKYADGAHVHPSDTSKQNVITASGILKGNGSGGVSAAVPGTDYLVTAHEVPSGGDSGYVLSKASNTDYDLAWVAQSGGSSVDPYTSTPADLGNASAGSSDDYARGDHVHKMPSASDVGAIAAPGSPSAGDVLTYSSGAWAAAAPEHQIPSGGNAGECLAKNSATDYDLRWRTINDWTPAGLMRTSGSTAAKVAEWSFWSATQYPSWLVVTVGNSNTYAGAITLKVNGSTAYPIYINGAASSATNYTLPAGSYFVYFDGAKFDFRTDGKIPGDITGHAGGDIAAPASPTTGDFLCWNGSAWAATSMSAWQGGNY